MNTQELIHKAIEARDRYERSFLMGFPERQIDVYEREYDKALDALTYYDRQYVSCFYDLVQAG